MDIDEDPTPRRGLGAPLGNHNALKHGYCAYVRKRKQERSTTGLIEEIAFLRTLVRRLYRQSRDDLTTPELMNVLRVLSLASSSLTRLLKAQDGLSTSPRPYRDMLEQALERAMREANPDEKDSP